MAKRKKPAAIEPFEALPAAEKERQAAEFDREFVADTFRPLTPAQRKLWQKARRKKTHQNRRVNCSQIVRMNAS